MGPNIAIDIEQIKNNEDRTDQDAAHGLRKAHQSCFADGKMITVRRSSFPKLSRTSHVMLSVIIPTEGVEAPAVATLAALIPGATAGVVQEVLLVDGAGNGIIERVADVAGCRFVSFQGSRPAALATGARQARAPWLMFLRAGAVLDAGWIEETTQFIQSVAGSGRPRAGVFRYARSPYAQPRFHDRLKSIMRSIAAPGVDQGLLIARDHYFQLGGYLPNARRSEARFLRRVGRSSRILLRSRIIVA